MKKVLMLLSVLLFSAMTALAVRLPSVGTGTSPNVWTKNFNGVLQAAAQTKYPILLIVVQDGSQGACGNCAKFVNLTLNSSEFKQLENSVTFYKVLINFYDGQGSTPYSEAISIYNKYKVAASLPVVAILDCYGNKRYSIKYSTSVKHNTTDIIKSYLLNGETGNPGSSSGSSGGSSAGGSSGDSSGDGSSGGSSSGGSSSISIGDYKGSYSGLVLDADNSIRGTVQFKLSSRGSAVVKATTSTGKSSVSSKLVVDNGGKGVTLKSQNGSSVAISNTGGSMWVGTFNGYKVIAKETQTQSNFAEFYTLACDSQRAGAVSAETKIGYLTAKIAKSGSVSVSGKLGSLKNRLSLSGKTVYLTANEVSQYFPALEAVNSLVVFAAKRGDSAVIVCTQDGRATCEVSFGDVLYSGDGSAYDYKTVDLKSLDGAALTIPGVDSITVAYNRNKLSPSSNANKVKLSVGVRKGTLKGTYTVGNIRYKYEGVLAFNEDGSLAGFAMGEKSAKPDSQTIILLGKTDEDCKDDCTPEVDVNGGGCVPGVPGSSCD